MSCMFMLRAENCLRRGLVWSKVIWSANALNLPCEISFAIFNTEVNLIAVYPSGMFYTNLGLESQASHFLSFQRACQRRLAAGLLHPAQGTRGHRVPGWGSRYFLSRSQLFVQQQDAAAELMSPPWEGPEEVLCRAALMNSYWSYKSEVSSL